MRKYFFVVFYNVKINFEKIFADNKKLGKASLFLFFIAVLYTFTVGIGYTNGFGAVVEPILKIPADEYYYYEMFFAIPLFFIIAVVFGGVSRLFSHIIGGKGSFENNYAIYATVSVVPTFITMWLPETVLIVFMPHMRAEPLGGFKNMPIWLDAARQIFGLLWPLVIAVVGIRISEKISYLKAFIVTFFSFLIAGFIMFIFVR